MEDRKSILEMVASGKLSASEAAELLAASKSAPAKAPEPEAPPKAETPPAGIKYEVIEVEEEPVKKAKGKAPTWLHVRVSDSKTGKRKVTVNVPLRLVKIGMKLGGGFVPELRDIDVDDLTGAIAEDGSGMLVDVMDEADGHHVQVYVD